MFLLVLLLFAPVAIASAENITPVPAVGATIPDVTVRTVKNEPLLLRQAVAEKPAVLVFYRGGWCPYCTKHLAALANIEADLAAAGFQILAISPDHASKLREKPDHQALGYTLLSDSTMEAAKAFGITFQVPAQLVSKYKNEYQIDLEAASGQTHHLLPHPAVYVVGTDGVIRFAHVNEDYKVRLEPGKILEAVKAL